MLGNGHQIQFLVNKITDNDFAHYNNKAVELVIASDIIIIVP